MNKVKVAVSLIIIIISCTGCTINESENDDLKEDSAYEPVNVTETVISDYFRLDIDCPTEAKVDSTIMVTGKLEYIGDNNVTLFYGKPIIRFLVLDQYGDIVYNPAYNDEGFTTELVTGDAFEIKDDFILKSPGIYKVIGFTVPLSLDDVYYEGHGIDFWSDFYDNLDRNLSDSAMRFIASKLTVDNLSIEVK